MEGILKKFEIELKENELAENSIMQYMRDVREYITFNNISNIADITKENLITFKDYLVAKSKPATVNNKLVIINQFLVFIKLDNLKLKLLRIQNKSSVSDVMSVVDYERLKRTALRLKRIRTYYIMRTLAETGIRIEELKYVSLEVVRKGTAQITNKKKIRDIVFSKELSKELLKYCKENNIKEGLIFFGRNKEKVLNASGIWKELQYIAGQARVKKKKVHAHGFRHLFSKEFLKQNNNDLFTLADLLGHISLETTRLYAKQSIFEQRKALTGLYK